MLLTAPSRNNSASFAGGIAEMDNHIGNGAVVELADLFSFTGIVGEL
jgi:hypothetical protein